MYNTQAVYATYRYVGKDQLCEQLSNLLHFAPLGTPPPGTDLTTYELQGLGGK